MPRTLDLSWYDDAAERPKQVITFGAGEAFKVRFQPDASVEDPDLTGKSLQLVFSDTVQDPALISLDASSAIDADLESGDVSWLIEESLTFAWDTGVYHVELRWSDVGENTVLSRGNANVAANPLAAGEDPPAGQSAAGDLSGSYPAPTVAKIRGRAVADVAPQTGEGLIWNASLARWEPGSVTAASHVHTQSVASAAWTITHGLGKYPSASVFTSAGDQVFGAVTYVSANQITIAFSGSFAGVAYLN